MLVRKISTEMKRCNLNPEFSCNRGSYDEDSINWTIQLSGSPGLAYLRIHKICQKRSVAWIGT
jgi:hypothetical protein